MLDSIWQPVNAWSDSGLYVADFSSAVQLKAHSTGSSTFKRATSKPMAHLEQRQLPEGDISDASIAGLRDSYDGCYSLHIKYLLRKQWDQWVVIKHNRSICLNRAAVHMAVSKKEFRD